MNIIYSIELHNIDNIDNIDNEENTNKVLNIKLSAISKKITYYITKITTNKKSYNNLDNDGANISDKDTNNLSFFINYIFEYILNISNNNDLDYQIFYNIIDKYISKDIYNNNNNITLFDKELFDNIINNNDVININKLFIISN